MLSTALNWTLPLIICSKASVTCSSRMVDDLTEEELSKHAVTIAKKDFVDIGLLLRGEFTLPSFLNILENWSRMSSTPYKHEINNDVHNFILQHDNGKELFIFDKRTLSIHTRGDVRKKIGFYNN
jgi:hypothetical protein